MKLENKIRKLFVMGAISAPLIFSSVRAEDSERLVETYNPKTKKFDAEYIIKSGDIEQRFPIKKTTVASDSYSAQNKKNKTDEKIETLIKKMKQEQKPEYYCELSDFYEKKGDLDKAIDVLRIGTTIFKNESFLYNRLGDLIEDPIEAISCFEKCLELNPKDGNAWNGLGYNLWDLGKKQEALKALKKGAELGDKKAIINYKCALEKINK